MELFGFASISGWFITVAIIVCTLYLYSKWKHSLWKSVGVPGPDPIPYMGIMKSYFKKGTCHTDRELIETYGDIVGIYQCHHPVLLVADPDLIKEIFIKGFSKFTNRPLPVNPPKDTVAGVATAKDAHWKFLRNTLSPTFTSSKLKMMMPKIHRCCRDLIANIESQSVNEEPVDMREACGSYTMDIIASTAFGIEINSQKDPNNKFVYYGKKAAIGQLAKPLVLFMMMFPFLKKWFSVRINSKEVVGFFHLALESAIKLRQEGKEEYHDFLQLMLNARQNEDTDDTSVFADSQEYKNRGLNESEIKGNALVFFLAGYDTTANTLSFACYTLATRRDIQDKIVDEIDTVLNGEDPQFDTIGQLQYLDKFFSEVLRLYGAAVRFGRESKEDSTVNGVFIPKGADIVIPIFALHRNPKYWPDPDYFDPERFTEENKAKRPEYSYLPFGIGPRICLGRRLALLEAKMALVYMVQNFTFSACDKTEIPVTFDKGILLRAVNGIMVKLNPRSKK